MSIYSRKQFLDFARSLQSRLVSVVNDASLKGPATINTNLMYHNIIWISAVRPSHTTALLNVVAVVDSSTVVSSVWERLLAPPPWFFAKNERPKHASEISQYSLVDIAVRSLTNISKTLLSYQARILSVSSDRSLVCGLIVVNRVWGADSVAVLTLCPTLGKVARSTVNSSLSGWKDSVVFNERSIIAIT